ncbi:MAG: hypothetical protein WCK97_02010 [Actinomycetes bacterium]
MSIDPNQPPVVPGPREPGQPTATSATTQPTGMQQQFVPPAYEPPPVERPLLEKRPEILIGLAAAGGFVAAQVLGRMRGR